MRAFPPSAFMRQIGEVEQGRISGSSFKGREDETKIRARKRAGRAGLRRALRHFSSEDKILIILEGLRGEDRIASLVRPSA
jgi:hypothetical protein